MKIFIEFNILIVCIIIVRQIFKRKISYQLRYSLWILLPVFLILSSLVSIPIRVQVPERYQIITSDGNQTHETLSAPMTYEELPTDKPILYPLNKETVQEYKTANSDIVTDKSAKIETDPASISDSIIAQSKTEKRINVASALRAVYWSGVGLVLSIILINNVVFACRIMKKRKYYAISEYGDLPVFRLEKLRSPFLFLHSIYIDENMDVDSSLYKYATCHEYCHYKQKDNIWIALRYLILILFWFDPLVWTSWILSQRDSELSADEGVIRILGKTDTKSYASSLLNLVTNESRYKGMLTASTSMSGKSSSFTKERVVSIVRGTRRSVAATLCIAVFATSIVGCSVFKVKNKYTLSEKRYVPKDAPWYTSKDIKFDMEKYGSVHVDQRVIISSDTYFVSEGSGFWYDEKSDPQTYLTKIDFEGNVIEECNITEQLTDKDVVAGYSGDGTDSIIVQSRDAATNLLQYYAYDVDYSSSSLLNEQLIPTNDVFKGQTYICSVRECDHFLVYLIESNESGEYAFLTYDWNTRTYEAIPIYAGRDQVLAINDDPYSHMSRCAKEQLFYSSCSDNTQVIYAFHPSSGEFEKVRSGVYGLTGYWLEDGSYIRMEDGNLVRKDARTGDVMETIVDFHYSIVNNNTTDGGIAAYSNGRVIYYSEDEDVMPGCYNQKYVIVEKADVNPHAGKEIFTIGYFEGSYSSNLDQFVEEYNGQNNDYFVEISDKYGYFALVSDGMSIIEARAYVNDLLISDIRSGQGPDIVVGSADFSSAIPELIFSDLSKYMKDTIEMEKDAYAPIVFHYSSSGKAYVIPYGLDIEGISIESDKLDITGCTYTEYIDLINHKGTGKDAIEEMLQNLGYAGDGVLSDTDYFTYLYEISSENYLENGKLNITKGDNGEKYRELAEFVHNRNDAFETQSDSENITISASSIYCFNDYLASSYGRMSMMVGYPSSDRAGLYSRESYTFSITNCCPDKDAAWKVASHLLEYGFQKKLADRYVIPVRLDAIEADADEVILSINNGFTRYYNWDVYHADLASWKAQYIQYVMNIEYIRSYDPSIVVILSEEMPAYFHGDKSLDDVCAIIESRVNNMLEERK